MKIKVGIDTFGCDHGRSGIGSYLVSLTENFKNSEDIEFELFGAEIDRYTYGSENNLNFVSINLPDSEKAEIFWHLFYFKRFAKKQKYDVVLFPAPLLYLSTSKKIPSVAVLNDIFSDSFDENSFIEKLQQKSSLKKAARIIVPSNFLRKDLKKFDIDNDKITVVHNGIDHSLFYPHGMITSENFEIKPFAIQKPYFIYASKMSSAQKKHCELIKAFSMFKKKTGLPHRLVLAGSEGEYFEQIKKAAYESEFATDIFIAGYFPHESFPSLYAVSEGCIFPSEIEGVGLPVLEAMATGIPVACSNSGALQEMAGDNVVYFDSNNVEEIAESIEKIAVDSDEKKVLVKNGIDWARRFSWEKTASETISVLREVVELKNGSKKAKKK